jgi:hypothetical protein
VLTDVSDANSGFFSWRSGTGFEACGICRWEGLAGIVLHVAA